MRAAQARPSGARSRLGRAGRRRRRASGSRCGAPVAARPRRRARRRPSTGPTTIRSTRLLAASAHTSSRPRRRSGVASTKLKVAASSSWRVGGGLEARTRSGPLRGDRERTARASGTGSAAPGIAHEPLACVERDDLLALCASGSRRGAAPRRDRLRRPASRDGPGDGPPRTPARARRRRGSRPPAGRARAPARSCRRGRGRGRRPPAHDATTALA